MRFAARGVEELELLDALLVEIFHAEGDGDSYMAARLHSELGRLGGPRTPLLFPLALFATPSTSNATAGCAKLSSDSVMGGWGGAGVSIVAKKKSWSLQGAQEPGKRAAAGAPKAAARRQSKYKRRTHLPANKRGSAAPSAGPSQEEKDAAVASAVTAMQKIEEGRSRERDAIASAKEYIRSLAGSADHNLRRGGAENFAAASLGAENKGFQMLRAGAAGGWKEGAGLGKEGEGMLDPVALTKNTRREGLGTAGGGGGNRHKKKRHRWHHGADGMGKWIAGQGGPPAAPAAASAAGVDVQSLGAMATAAVPGLAGDARPTALQAAQRAVSATATGTGWGAAAAAPARANGGSVAWHLEQAAAVAAANIGVGIGAGMATGGGAGMAAGGTGLGFSTQSVGAGGGGGGLGFAAGAGGGLGYTAAENGRDAASALAKAASVASSINARTAGAAAAAAGSGAAAAAMAMSWTKGGVQTQSDGEAA